MKTKQRLPLAISFFILLICSYSCVKDNFDLREKLSTEFVWNPELALPVAHGKLTLADLVQEKEDTIQFISERDLGYGSSTEDLVIQLRYAIDTGRKVDIMRLPIMEPYDTTLYLDPIELHDVNATFTLRMNDFVQDNFLVADYTAFQMYEATAPTNTLQHSAVNETVYFEVMPFAFMEYALISEGFIDATVHNNFAVPLMCELVLLTDSAGIDIEIATFDFSNGGTQWIPAGDSRTATRFMDSTYIGSIIKYQYRNVRLGSAINVSVDLQDRLNTEINLRDMTASEGRAIIPNQTIKMDSLIYVTVRDRDVTKGLSRVVIEQGAMNYRITSSIEAATHFVVDFPSMTFENNEVSKEAILTRGNPVHQSQWDLSNHDLDLTQNPEISYNSLPVRLGYRVDTDTEMMSFGPQQNINIVFTNTDSIYFSFIEGNLGETPEQVFTDELDFNIQDFIDNFLSGEITFHDPKLRIVYDNPFGIPGMFELNLLGKDGKGKEVDMFGGYSNEFLIEAPSCAQVVADESVVSVIELNKHTSNIVEFMKLLPSAIEYSGVYHPNYGETPPYINCVTNARDAQLSIEAELPMRLSIKNLVLEQEIALSDISGFENIEDIQRLRVYFYTENMLPLDVQVKISMLDTTAVNPNLGELAMYPLKSAGTINGKVPRSGLVNRHTEVLEIDAAVDNRLEKLLQANKLLLQIFLETDQQGDVPVIFYTYYSLTFQMAIDGKFIYRGRF